MIVSWLISVRYWLVLQHLCRQSREAVQVTYELDVVYTEYVEHETAIQAGDMTRDGSVRPIDVNTVLKGRLHLRMANVGHPADPKLRRGEITCRDSVLYIFPAQMM